MTLLGKPDVITDMKYGGTRYKYLHGVMIDHVASTGIFCVAQAASPKSVKLGEARTLEAAEALALARADLPWPPGTYAPRCSGCSGPLHPGEVCPNRPDDDDPRMTDLDDDSPQHEGEV